jgi:hypothetical protein
LAWNAVLREAPLKRGELYRFRPRARRACQGWLYCILEFRVAQPANRLSRWPMSLMAFFEHQGGAMKLSKYRYVTIKSGKVVPQYSTKTEARSAIKELKLIKREVRLEKRKLQNRKKQLKTRYAKEVRQYTLLLDNKKKYRGNALAVIAFKKRKKRQLALLREPIDANQRKLEIIIAEIDGEIIKIEAKKLYMKT